MKSKTILATLGVTCLTLLLAACGYGDKEPEKTMQSEVEAETSGSLTEDIETSAGSVDGSAEADEEQVRISKQLGTMQSDVVDMEDKAAKMKEEADAELNKLPK